MSKRFGSITETEIAEKRTKAVPNSTHKSNFQAATALRQYIQEKGDEDSNFADISEEKLDSYLQSYYFDARQVGGTYKDYKTSSLETFRHGINRYFRDECGRNLDISHNPVFTKSNQHFKTALKHLKQKGFGAVSHHPQIAKTDLRALYASPQFDPRTPKGLANKVQFDIRYYMCRRGSENIHNMTKNTFQIKLDIDLNVRYVVKIQDEMNKNHDETDREIYSGIIPESGLNDPMCPVKTFESYLRHLNPMCEYLWQRPRLDVDLGDVVWYCKSRLGPDKLDKFMKSLSDQVGLSQKYTNHCIRVTSTSILTKNKFADGLIMKITGHKSQTSLSIYQHLDNDDKLDMGNTLGKALGTESTTSKGMHISLIYILVIL
jgi:hypothetical protein